jgi:hypothetical protein
MTGTPIRVTFSGKDSVTIAANDSIDSDLISLACTTSQKLLVAIFATDRDFMVSSGAGRLSYRNTATGDSSQVQSVKNGVNGWTTYTVDYVARVIAYTPPPANVYESSHAATPVHVLRDGVRLDRYPNASIAALDSNYNWYYNAGKLYVYSSTDPSLVSWQVPQRNLGISITNKNNITVDGLDFQYMNAGADTMASAGIGIVGTVNLAGLLIKNINTQFNAQWGLFAHMYNAATLGIQVQNYHGQYNAIYNSQNFGSDADFGLYGEGGYGLITTTGTDNILTEYAAVGNVGDTVFRGAAFGITLGSVTGTATRLYSHHSMSSGINQERGSKDFTATTGWSHSNGSASADANGLGIGGTGLGCINCTWDGFDFYNNRKSNIEVSLTTYTPHQHQQGIILKNIRMWGGQEGGLKITDSDSTDGLGHEVTLEYATIDSTYENAVQQMDDYGKLTLYNITATRNRWAGLYDQATGDTLVARNLILKDNDTSNASFEVIKYERVGLFDMDYDCIYNADGRLFEGRSWAQWQALGIDTHSINADPSLVSTSDLRLNSDSPALNTGIDVGLTADVVGNPVPSGSTTDIGAYEMQTGMVITQAASSIEDSTATGNGTITIGAFNATTEGFEWDIDSGAPYANSVTTDGDYGSGAYTGSLVMMPTGRTIYTRAKIIDPVGTSYGDEVNFLLKPGKVTGVTASKGTYTDSVVVSWNASVGTDDYVLYRDDYELGAGDPLHQQDTGADAGTITPGTADASDGSTATHITLTISDADTTHGTEHVYTVIASNDAGESDVSDSDTGWRGIGALSYQWYRSVGDSDASYSAILGGTTNPYDDIGAPTDGSGRYYKCLLSAQGATSQYSTADRGRMMRNIIKRRNHIMNILLQIIIQ